MPRCVGVLALVALGCGAPDTVPPVAERPVLSGRAASEDSLLRLGYMSLAPNDSIRFALRPVAPSRLVRFLADGQRRTPDPVDGQSPPSDPAVFLYSVGSWGGCIEDADEICYHDFLLTTRTNWTDALPLAYELGQFGDVTRVQWLETGARLRLQLVVQNWPQSVIDAHQGHRLRVDTIDLQFDADSVWVTRSTLAARDPSGVAGTDTMPSSTAGPEAR